MEFRNLNSLIKVFSNEYIKPGDIILIIGDHLQTDSRSFFDFLMCECIFISDKPGKDILVDYNSLPFEDHCFDIIINLNNINVNSILKPGGKMLVYGKGEHFYKIGNEYLSVV